MKTHQNKTPAALTDKVAATIASRIIKVQIRSSHWLNNWFNARSIPQKKRILTGFVLLVTILLVTGLGCPYDTLPKSSQGFTSGITSRFAQFPKHPSDSHSLTDSLTIKTKP